MTERLCKNDFYSNFTSCFNNVLSSNSFFFLSYPWFNLRSCSALTRHGPWVSFNLELLFRPQPLPQHIHKSLERMSLKFQGSCVHLTEWGDTMLSSPQSITSATCFCWLSERGSPQLGGECWGWCCFQQPGVEAHLRCRFPASTFLHQGKGGS